MEVVLLDSEQFDNIVIDGVNGLQLELILLDHSDNRENLLSKHCLSRVDNSAFFVVDTFEGLLKGDNKFL